MQRTEQYEQMKQLNKKGFTTVTELEKTRVELDLAKIQLSSVRDKANDSIVSKISLRLADAVIELEVEKLVEVRLREEMECILEQSAAARKAEEVDLRLSEQRKVISALKDRLTELQEKSTLLKLQSV